MNNSGLCKSKIGFLLLLAVIGLEGVSSKRTHAVEALAPSADDTQEQDLGNTALLHPLDGLSAEEKRDFYIGKSFFHSNWVVAPATTTAREGLGPYFNARACGGCHIGNGRGALAKGERLESPGALVVRLSLPDVDAHGTPLPEATYGTELSAFSIPGVAAEGKVVVTFAGVPGRYDDVTTYTLRKPRIELKDLSHGALAKNVQIAPRFAPSMAGLGLLAGIAESDIEAEAAKQVASTGPVKGKINRVWNPLASRIELGRFGWKANVSSLTTQTVSAFLTDIGITSRFAPEQNCTAAEADCRSARIGKSPEIDDVTLSRVVTYVALLAPPPRQPMSAEARRGEKLFERMGCAGCHKTEYRVASANIPVPKEITSISLPASLVGSPVRAYTDLLLHDMGDGLADSRKEFLANERQWRTPPLWGLGLTVRVSGGEAYLHDGRARSVDEAILWHGGEAESAREAFRTADEADRSALTAFLRSL